MQKVARPYFQCRILTVHLAPCTRLAFGDGSLQIAQSSMGGWRDEDRSSPFRVMAGEPLKPTREGGGSFTLEVSLLCFMLLHNRMLNGRGDDPHASPAPDCALFVSGAFTSPRKKERRMMITISRRNTLRLWLGLALLTLTGSLTVVGQTATAAARCEGDNECQEGAR